MAETDNIVTKLQQGNQLMGQLVNIMTSLFPRSMGTFTAAASNSTTIVDSKCTTTSAVIITPTNGAAGTLQGSAKCFYIAPANGSFTVYTSNTASAVGVETFSYVIFSPL